MASKEPTKATSGSTPNSDAPTNEKRFKPKVVKAVDAE
jgi:hypothetical protein